MRTRVLSIEVTGLLCFIENLRRLAVIILFISITCALITRKLILEVKWDSRPSRVICDDS